MKKELSSQYINRTSKDYSLYVNEVRGIPLINDGLKDGQRKAMWLMRNKAEKLKTVALGGQMIAEELYVHGDMSANKSISELAAPFKNNICYLDGIGTFGSKLAPDAFGAPRYTYVKRSKAAEDILFTDLEIVPLMENYDGSNHSARHFLPLLPTILLNGVSGMGVGWSTEILPHKFSDIVDACLNTLDEKKIKKLKPHYENYNVQIDHIEDSSWSITGKIKIVDHSNIIIQDLPPGLKIEKLREHLDKLEEEDKIYNYIDKSTDEVDVRVQFKRGRLPEITKVDGVDGLIKLFKLRTRLTQRIVVIGWDGKSIKTYDSPEDLVKDFVPRRLAWFTNRYQRLLDITLRDLVYYRSLKLCFDNDFSDKLPKLKNKQEAVDWVKKTTSKLNTLDEQILKIVSLPSYKWTKEGLDEVVDEIKRLENLKKEYTTILASKEKIKDIYKQELNDLKKKYS